MYETILVVRHGIKLLLDKYGLGERPDVAHISLSWSLTPVASGILLNLVVVSRHQRHDGQAQCRKCQ